MESEFLDLKSKARELDMDYMALRARILSAKMPCFVYLAGIRLHSIGAEDYLPPWNRKEFPSIRWEDHGAIFTSSFDGGPKDAPPRENRYTVRGFAMLDRYPVEEILTKGKVGLDRQWVHICDRDFIVVASLVASVPEGMEWVDASPEEHRDGGFTRYFPITITADDIFIPSERPRAPTPNVSVSTEYPEELRAAVEAFQAVSRTFKPGRSPKTALTEWLAKHKPELGSHAINRVATLVNWQKQGGAPKTPRK